ncbi:hypothetical protein PFISCL1PPCAC_1357, partial [Pristionchus fissidentatus]
IGVSMSTLLHYSSSKLKLISLPNKSCDRVLLQKRTTIRRIRMNDRTAMRRLFRLIRQAYSSIIFFTFCLSERRILPKSSLPQISRMSFISNFTRLLLSVSTIRTSSAYSFIHVSSYILCIDEYDPSSIDQSPATT